MGFATEAENREKPPFCVSSVKKPKQIKKNQNTNCKKLNAEGWLQYLSDKIGQN